MKITTRRSGPKVKVVSIEHGIHKLLLWQTVEDVPLALSYNNGKGYILWATSKGWDKLDTFPDGGIVQLINQGELETKLISAMRTIAFA